jgi:hypothetical protein
MVTKKEETKAEQPMKKEAKFSKKQLMVSKRFRDKNDLLVALLNEDKLYTSHEVDELIEKYNKTEVK